MNSTIYAWHKKPNLFTSDYVANAELFAPKVIGYRKAEPGYLNSCKKIWYLFINFFKSLCNQSDWQVAKKDFFAKIGRPLPNVMTNRDASKIAEANFYLCTYNDERFQTKGDKEVMKKIGTLMGSSLDNQPISELMRVNMDAFLKGISFSYEKANDFVIAITKDAHMEQDTAKAFVNVARQYHRETLAAIQKGFSVARR